MELQHRPLPCPSRKKGRAGLPRFCLQAPNFFQMKEGIRCQKGVPLWAKGRDAGGRPKLAGGRLTGPFL